MSNVLAALGSAQLSTLEHRVAARRSVFARYEDLLGGVDGIAFMKEDSQGISNRWLTTLTIDAGKFGASNLDVVAALEAENIEARPILKPMQCPAGVQRESHVRWQCRRALVRGWIVFAERDRSDRR